MRWVVPTETIRVLHPIGTVRSIHGSCIACNVVEDHICAIHDVQGPQRRILDSEILYKDFRHIPEDKRHRSSRLRDIFFDIVPSVAIAVDLPRSVSLDGNMIPSQDKARVVVLEGDGIGVIAPVVEVIRKLSSY